MSKLGKTPQEFTPNPCPATELASGCARPSGQAGVTSPCPLQQDACRAAIGSGNVGQRIPGVCTEPGAALHSSAPLSAKQICPVTPGAAQEHGKVLRGEILLLPRQRQEWLWIPAAGSQGGMKLQGRNARVSSVQHFMAKTAHNTARSQPHCQHMAHIPLQVPWDTTDTARPSGRACGEGEHRAPPAQVTLCQFTSKRK